MTPREMFCFCCDAETLFVAPPCPEEHEEDCPELLCTGCGTAVFVAPVELLGWVRPHGTAVASQQRRAA
jgi:hypothetical protein